MIENTCYTKIATETDAERAWRYGDRCLTGRWMDGMKFFPDGSVLGKGCVATKFGFIKSLELHELFLLLAGPE